MTTALVTGASGAIGAAIARALAGDGLDVAVAYRSNREGAEKVAAAVEEAGSRSLVVALDVADESSIDRAFSSVEDSLGSVSVLVNNAGSSRDGLTVRYPTEALHATIATNLAGAFLCSRRALRSMLRERHGRIVNVSSAAAVRGNPGQVAYSAAKAGLLGLTRSLAREVGSRGITVNVVCPGVVDSAMTRSLPDDALAALVAATPAGRAGSPEEVAAVVRFLTTEEAAYVNGAVVTVDGGLSA